MLTFNLRASSGNYYRGHRPSNKHGNCWGDRESALTLSIEQARQFLKTWLRSCDIVIAMESTPIDKKEWEKEVFCLEGGSWYEFKENNKCQT